MFSGTLAHGNIKVELTQKNRRRRRAEKIEKVKYSGHEEKKPRRPNNSSGSRGRHSPKQWTNYLTYTYNATTTPRVFISFIIEMCFKIYRLLFTTISIANKIMGVGGGARDRCYLLQISLRWASGRDVVELGGVDAPQAVHDEPHATSIAVVTAVTGAPGNCLQSKACTLV